MAQNETNPISPISGRLPYATPKLTLSAAAVNDEPVELDGTPTSPENTAMPNQEGEQFKRRGSRAQILEDMSSEDKEKRDQLISERKTDPAVLVDIPQTPGAEEFGKSTEGETTAI